MILIIMNIPYPADIHYNRHIKCESIIKIYKSKFTIKIMVMKTDKTRRRAAKDKRTIRKLLHKATGLPISEAWIKGWRFNRLVARLSGTAFKDRSNITYFRTRCFDKTGRQYVISVHVPNKEDGEIDDPKLYHIKAQIEEALDSFLGVGKWGSSRPCTHSGHSGSYGMVQITISYWLPNLK